MVCHYRRLWPNVSKDRKCGGNTEIGKGKGLGIGNQLTYPIIKEEICYWISSVLCVHRCVRLYHHTKVNGRGCDPLPPSEWSDSTLFILISLKNIICHRCVSNLGLPSHRTGSWPLGFYHSQIRFHLTFKILQDIEENLWILHYSSTHDITKL